MLTTCSENGTCLQVNAVYLQAADSLPGPTRRPFETQSDSNDLPIAFMKAACRLHAACKQSVCRTFFSYEILLKKNYAMLEHGIFLSFKLLILSDGGEKIKIFTVCLPVFFSLFQIVYFI